MMGIVEFSTAVRHRLPLMMVVVNDGGYGAERTKLSAYGVDPRHALIAWPDLADADRALGGYGVTVRTLADLALVADHVDFCTSTSCDSARVHWPSTRPAR
jgi:acetolactate synthase I/II/III large subunit